MKAGAEYQNGRAGAEKRVRMERRMWGREV